MQISTSEYKIKPIKAEVRRRLGYPHPTRVPAGVWAQVAIGISVDEVHRARDADVAALLRRGFDVVHADLATLGYDTSWSCLRASDIGAAHRCDRLFLLAAPADQLDAGHNAADAVRP